MWPEEHLVIIRSVPDSSLPTEVLLQQGGTARLPKIEAFENMFRDAALFALGNAFLFHDNPPKTSYSSVLELISKQTGITAKDFVFTSGDTVGLALRADRMPFRYLSSQIYDNQYMWVGLDEVVKSGHFDDRERVKQAIRVLKKVDDKAKRTVNAGITIYSFSEHFGYNDNPVRKPRIADKKAVKWVFDELKAGTLEEEALEAVIELLETRFNLGDELDNLYHLYRLAWRELTTQANRDYIPQDNSGKELESAPDIDSVPPLKE